MAKKVDAAFLLRKSMRVMNKHLTQLNRKLSAGKDINGQEAQAIAAYTRAMREGVKAQERAAAKRADALNNLTNEELKARAEALLAKGKKPEEKQQ